MNYLHRGLRHTGTAIRAHLFLFILLLILQVLVVGGTVYAGLTYQVRIMEDLTTLLKSADSANYGQETLQSGQPFLKDTLKLYQAYRSLIDKAIQLALWVGGLLFIGNGILWLLSLQIIAPSTFFLKETGKRALKYVVSALIIFTPIIAASYFSLKNLVARQAVEALPQALKEIAIVFLVGYYFFLIALATISFPAWREFLRSFWRTAIYTIHKTLFLFLLNAALLFGGLYLIYLSLNYPEQGWLVLASSFLLLLLVVLLRVYWIASVQEIGREERAIV